MRDERGVASDSVAGVGCVAVYLLMCFMCGGWWLV